MKQLYKGLLFAMVLSCSSVVAQQVAQFSQYQQSLFVMNPAATGAAEDLNVNLGYRNQWLGLGNSPTTFFIGAEKGIKMSVVDRHPLALRTSHNESYHIEQNDSSFAKIKHGVGGYLMSDNYGSFSKNILSLSYAAHYGINENLTASAGLNLGFSNFKFDQSIATPEDASESTYQNFIAERAKFGMFDVNIGVYLYGKDYYVGYSTNQLLGDKVALTNLSSPVLLTHHTFMAGYKKVVNDKTTISPSFIYKNVKAAPSSFAINCKAEFNQKYYGGLGYRSGDAVILLIGFMPNAQMNVGYSFDFNTSTLRKYSSGSHEINVTYCIK